MRKTLKSYLKNNQVATQYVDFKGKPTYDYDIKFNPNGFAIAIEGITSSSWKSDRKNWT